MDGVFSLVLEKQSVQNPDVGANIVVTTQKHIHYMPFFHPAVSYIQRKLWVYEKYRKSYYRIIARLLKPEKKKGIFLFYYYFLSLSLVSTFLKSNLFSHLKSQIFHSQLFLHIPWLSRNKI